MRGGESHERQCRCFFLALGSDCLLSVTACCIVVVNAYYEAYFVKKQQHAPVNVAADSRGPISTTNSQRLGLSEPEDARGLVSPLSRDAGKERLARPFVLPSYPFPPVSSACGTRGGLRCCHLRRPRENRPSPSVGVLPCRRRQRLHRDVEPCGRVAYLGQHNRHRDDGVLVARREVHQRASDSNVRWHGIPLNPHHCRQRPEAIPCRKLSKSRHSLAFVALNSSESFSCLWWN